MVTPALERQRHADPERRNYSACGSSCMLTSTGTVNKATVDNSYAGFVLLGFSLNQAAGGTTKGTVTPTGTGIQLSYSVAGPKPLRLILKTGSSPSSYCVNLTGSTDIDYQVPYTMFNSDCTGSGTGESYGKSPISEIQAEVPGGSASTGFGIALGSLKEY